MRENSFTNVRQAWRGAAPVCGGALMLLSVAAMNHYPLLYPDSVQYVSDGHSVWHGLLHGANPALGVMRSPIYSVAVLPWHWDLSPWPVVVFQALVTAYVLRLVMRVCSRGPAGSGALRYLALMAVLSALTTVSWYASLLMPDIFGAVAYLSVLLLVFARERLSRARYAALAVIAGFGFVAHLTHLLLGLLLCVALLLLFALLCKGAMRGGGRGVALMTLVWVCALAAQVGINKRIYGVAGVSVKRVPYLTARLVADGPARKYLEAHCPTLGWAICAHVRELPDNDDAFLWETGGIWASATPAEQNAMRREEMPLAVATLRAYPRETFRIMLRNAFAQLTDFGVDDFDNNQWMEGALDNAMPGSHARYIRSLQARNAVPAGVFTTLQTVVVVASLLALGALVPGLWRRRERFEVRPLLWMCALLVPLLVVNALLTGALSEVDSRYQARVVWIVPLLAGLACIQWREGRATRICTF